ncbi:D-galactose-binding periplasmic protein [Paracholeplasma brassicae]|uniref:D-galactose/methyl-galactoside binding periplasmic protein MglB n=1 Tax=Acholeplasma brassicae TaxID=61635 RepID=U4KQW0_9MOLU|nr:galactose ABC transporter substrate-binding protein [Paracholeplasma brassicae]CCV65198.1 D-galactose-binding periplasmic protein [Paracholeplasma brassicae]
MKRIFALMVTLLLAVTMFACEEDGEFKVDIFIYKYSDTYITSVRNAMDAELKGIDVNYTFHDADGSQETQNTQIDGAIANGTDLIVVNIVETESGNVVIQKAKNAKIPVIFFNREVSDAVVNSYDDAAFIGTDPDEAGYMQGEMIADLLLADGAWEKYDLNNDGKINYIMLRADLDNPEANGRTKYSTQEANRLLVAASKPELVQIGTDQMAGWDLATAKTMTDALLTSNPYTGDQPIELVIANNDDMALGAIQSLNGVGYNTGSDATKYVLVVGVDATATAVDAIQGGKMAGSIKQDGVAMAKAIVKFIENVSLDKDFNEGTDYTFETGADKVRIPYAKYTGE